MENNKKGLFITFEGADGCGKTTQAKLVKEYLDQNNIPNILTREPGDGALGLELRNILLHTKEPVSNIAETFLYLADRAQHIEYTILPALKKGEIVLCDRYIDSTVSYQGYGRGLDIDMLKKMNGFATGNLLPDLTIVYDIDSKIAQMRLGGEKDRLEKEGLNFHMALRNGYLELAKSYPERIKVINANDSIENIQKKTIELILGFIK